MCYPVCKAMEPAIESDFVKDDFETAIASGAKVWILFCRELKFLSIKRGFSLGSVKIAELIIGFR